MKKFFKSVLSLMLAFAMVCGSVTVYGAQVDLSAEFQPTGGVEFIEDELTEEPAVELQYDEDYQALSAYWTQFETDYYYNQLDADEKAWWDGMESVCASYLEGTATASLTSSGYYVTDYVVLNNWEKEKMRKCYKLFKYSHPEFYFLDNGVSFYSGSGRVAFMVIDAFAEGSTRASCTQQFKSSVDACIAKIDMSLLPEQRERIVHDIVLGLADYEYNDYDQSAWSTFCMGITVCSGYTQAFSMLGRAAGLDVIPVTGDAGGSHAWNMINLHGIWYVVDTTWDDGSDYYRYYNKSYDYMYKHSPDSNIAAYVPATNYCSTDSYWDYIPGYFTRDDITYFSIDGRSNYLAWAIDVGVTAAPAIPEATIRDNTCYIVAGSDAYARIKTFMIRLYEIHLNRDPDVVGLNSWANSLATGKSSSASAIHGIVTSEEYRLKGYNSDMIVEQMYASMLGRASDADGKANWMSCLNSGMTVTSIVNGFSGSQEFANVCAAYGMQPGSVAITEARDLNPSVTKFVYRCYTEALGRGADTEGLNVWCGALVGGGTTPKQVAEQFVLSDEVKLRNLTNSQFVEMLYRFCMGRNADASGLSYWVGLLDQGYVREYVLNEFVTSNEFAMIVASFGL